MWLSTAELGGLADHLVGQLGWVQPGKGAAIEQLRRVPVEQLINVSSVFSRPAFGGAVLPDSPMQALPGGRFHRVPVLTGGTRDEARLFTALFWDAAGRPIRRDGYDKLLADGLDAAADEVAERYPVDAHVTPSLAWADVIGDAAWARSVWDFANALSAETATYVYELADRGPDLPGWQIFSSADPHVQSLHPEKITGTDFVAEHRLDFWSALA